MSRIALYRKYRPRTFDELYGQGHIAKTLKNSIETGNFAHAFLFCGPRGTGKTSAARLLAKAINCLNIDKGNPDNTCSSCLSINNDKALDIIEIDAASHTQVDNIREIIVERANFAPTTLKYKVYIIDEAHMLSKSSFNALLKTLEEPPKHVIFILATTEASKVIPTIVSRCQRFDFRRINQKDIVERLDFIAAEEHIDLEKGVTKLIATASDGGFRDAISLLDQVSSIRNGLITINDLEVVLGISNSTIVEDYVFSLLHKEQEKVLDIVQRIIEDGKDTTIFLKSSLEYLRKLLLLKIRGEKEVDLSLESIKTAQDSIKDINVSEILLAIDTLIKNEAIYRTSSIPQLALEVAAIKITDKSGSDTVETTPSIEVKPTPKKIKETEQDPKVTKTTKTTKPTVNELARWQEVLLEIKARNNSIHAFLKVCEPEFDDKTLTLYFPYKFHKERIEDVKNRQIVEDVLQKVFGRQYKVKCSLKPGQTNHAMEKPKNDDLLEEALQILGGEVID